MAMLAPMPSASMRTAVVVKPGAAQLAQGVAEVLHDGLEEGKRASFAMGLRGVLDAAELEDGLAASFGGSHAGAEIVVDVELQMAVDFGGELLLLPLRGDDTGESVKPCAKAVHHASSVGARKRARMAVVCSQLRASRSRRRCPARVSL